MKKFILFFSLLFMLCLAFQTHAQFTDAQNANLAYKNYAVNGGAENGKYGWSETGSGTLSVDTTTKNNGKSSIKFISAAGGDYLATSLVACKSGPNCLYKFYYSTTATTWTARVYDNSGNLINEKALPSTSGFAPESVSFVFTSGTYQIRFYDSSTGNTIYVDDLILGFNDFVSQLNGYYPQYDQNLVSVTGTNWITTRAVFIPYLTRDANTGAEVWRMAFNILGTISSENSALTLTVNGVTFKNGYTQLGQSVSASLFRSGIDHRTTRIAYAQNNVSTIYIQDVTSEGNFDTISLSGNVELNSKPTWATATTSQLAVRAENSNYFAATRWNTTTSSAQITSGSFTNFNISGGDSARTNYGKAVNQSTAGDIAFKVTNLEPGIYIALFNGTVETSSNTTNTTCEFAITDGTTTRLTNIDNHATASETRGLLPLQLAIFEYSSMADRTFTLQARRVGGDGYCRIISQFASANTDSTFVLIPVVPKIAMSQIVNLPITKSVRIGQATDYSTCSTSPCTAYGNNTSWVTSITTSATGIYTVNIKNGTFNSAPTCTCGGAAVSVLNSCAVTATSTSSISIRSFRTDTQVNANEFLHLICTEER